MIYYKWRWFHDYDEDPVLFFVELDDDRWNTKSVEIFRDGRQVYADERHECGTFLGKEPYPPVEEINDGEEFFIEEITYNEFESVWKNRKEEYCEKRYLMEGEDE